MKYRSFMEYLYLSALESRTHTFSASSSLTQEEPRDGNTKGGHMEREGTWYIDRGKELHGRQEEKIEMRWTT